MIVSILRPKNGTLSITLGYYLFLGPIFWTGNGGLRRNFYYVYGFFTVVMLSLAGSEWTIPQHRILFTTLQCDGPGLKKMGVKSRTSVRMTSFYVSHSFCCIFCVLCFLKLLQWIGIYDTYTEVLFCWYHLLGRCQLPVYLLRKFQRHPLIVYSIGTLTENRGC